jgi:hypothetical protein
MKKMNKVVLSLALVLAQVWSYAQAEDVVNYTKQGNQDILAVVCGRVDAHEVSMSCLKEPPQFKVMGFDKFQVVSYKISLIDEEGNELILLHDTEKPITDVLEKAKYLKPIRMVIHDVVIMSGEKVNVFNKSFQYDIIW